METKKKNYEKKRVLHLDKKELTSLKKQAWHILEVH